MGPATIHALPPWAWLIEGGAQYFADQVPLFRAAMVRRMREGGRPAFPPSPRDAVILGWTLFDLLDKEVGPEACDRLVRRLHPQGTRGNLELAFDAPFAEIEREWRRRLRDQTSARRPRLSDTGSFPAISP